MKLEKILKRPVVTAEQARFIANLEGYRIEAEIYSHINYETKKPVYSASTIGIVFATGGSVFFSAEYTNNWETVFNRKTVALITEFQKLLKVELDGLNSKPQD